LGTQQYPCFSANFFAEFIVTTGRTPRNKALLSRSGLLPGTIFSKETHGEMIRFVVRRLCLRKADDPSVVNGCAKKSGSIRNNGLSEYLRNVDGQKLCLWEAGDYPVANDGCIKKRFAPVKQLRQMPPCSWRHFIPSRFYRAGKWSMIEKDFLIKGVQGLSRLISQRKAKMTHGVFLKMS